MKIIPPISNNIPNRDLAAEQREQTGGLTGNFENFSESWTSVQVSQRLVANAARATICPTHIRPPCFETRRCRNENRFSSRCSALSTPLLRGGGSEEACVERDCLSLLLSLCPSEGMEIDNIPLFEPVSPRPYGVFFYLVTWFFNTHSFKGWTPVSNLVSSFIFAFYSNWSVDALFHDLLRKILITSKFDCSAFWAVLYDILKSRNGRRIIKRGDWDILFAFESFSR